MENNLHTLLIIIASALIIFATRVIPFWIFSKKELPTFVLFIQKYIPAMIMAILVFYCFKDVDYSDTGNSLIYFLCIILTVILHLLFKNSLISIFLTTIIFMILSRIF